ncbi:hypothetical protein LTR70_000526 [Exophiala xenobiotica]|uniref:Uncharacterized protein n=1 Tax=Lithohypha guttulata TaxID=1690604 RepID=A0ABR0KB92_9EURO|nr:hypothetical protein LTR24_004666 [Lithohypha guttulata]KAK5329377.1 hypothetical protein LTR70_000526 [Exophiala xenobiotica]
MYDIGAEHDAHAEAQTQVQPAPTLAPPNAANSPLTAQSGAYSAFWYAQPPPGVEMEVKIRGIAGAPAEVTPMGQTAAATSRDPVGERPRVKMAPAPPPPQSRPPVRQRHEERFDPVRPNPNAGKELFPTSNADKELFEEPSFAGDGNPLELDSDQSSVPRLPNAANVRIAEDADSSGQEEITY